MLHPKFWRGDKAKTGRPVGFYGHLKVLLDQFAADSVEWDGFVSEVEQFVKAELASAQADVVCLWVISSANELPKASMAQMWTELTTRRYFRENE